MLCLQPPPTPPQHHLYPPYFYNLLSCCNKSLQKTAVDSINLWYISKVQILGHCSV